MAQLWPDKEAAQILKQHGADTARTYVFETGFGPSGKPHFGTFGEVIRTNYVLLALRDMGYQTHLIAFSDDMDGLRKIPEGFPEWLKDYIGHPVSAIPDPFETHESYSAHMNALLVEMLENLQLDFEFRSSAEAYKSGTFNAQIRMVIQQYEAVQEIIFPYLREETQENWFPFFPICENCGSVGHTRVTNVDKDNMRLSYCCDREFGGVPGCGHCGETSPFDGAGKLQWKVDWPARWHALGVHYEMFGKDLIESAEVGDRIVQRIFRAKPPSHMFYELFLDEKGAKISKSKGRGMDAELWQRYATRESLMYLMLDKPREAKSLVPRVIPRYMDLTNAATEAYFSDPDKRAREARHYQFITRFQPPAEAPVLVDYGTLANLVGNVGLSDPDIVEDYLRRSDLVSGDLSAGQRADLHTLIVKCKRFYDEQMTLDLEAPALNALDGFLLGQFVAFLEADEHDPDRIQNEIFETAKRENVEPKAFFRALYNALIKQERGPRGGAFIKLLGQETAAALIRERVAEAVQDIAPSATDGPQLSPLPVAIAPDVRAKYPDLAIGAAILEGVDIQTTRPEALEQQINAALSAVSALDPDTAIESGPIAAYRALFADFGINPNAMPPSPETILRLAAGDGRLPNVNNLVDVANLTVLETGISVALYDLDRLDGPLSLRFATAEDKHQALGTKRLEPVEAGELVYADDQEVICRALNHRDSDKTKIRTKTRRVLLIVDGAPGIMTDAVHAALAQHLDRTRAQVGGELVARGLIF
ncbi:MAG: lysine--tRNA ligase [Anaerolineales bacterium]